MSIPDVVIAFGGQSNCVGKKTTELYTDADSQVLQYDSKREAWCQWFDPNLSSNAWGASMVPGLGNQYVATYASNSIGIIPCGFGGKGWIRYWQYSGSKEYQYFVKTVLERGQCDLVLMWCGEADFTADYDTDLLTAIGNFHSNMRSDLSSLKANMPLCLIVPAHPDYVDDQANINAIFAEAASQFDDTYVVGNADDYNVSNDIHLFRDEMDNLGEAVCDAIEGYGLWPTVTPEAIPTYPPAPETAVLYSVANTSLGANDGTTPQDGYRLPTAITGLAAGNTIQFASDTEFTLTSGWSPGVDGNIEEWVTLESCDRFNGWIYKPGCKWDCSGIAVAITPGDYYRVRGIWFSGPATYAINNQAKHVVYEDCIFEDCGSNAINSLGNVSFVRCAFINTTGIHCGGYDVKAIDCYFGSSGATGLQMTTSGLLRNCIFNGCGTVRVQNAMIKNCTFYNMTNGIQVDGSIADIRKCIFHTVTNSVVLNSGNAFVDKCVLFSSGSVPAACIDGGGNVSAGSSPIVDPANSNFHRVTGSDLHLENDTVGASFDTTQDTVYKYSAGAVMVR